MFLLPQLFLQNLGLLSQINDLLLIILRNPVFYGIALFIMFISLTTHSLKMFRTRPARRLPHKQGDYIVAVPSLRGHSVLVYACLAPGSLSRIGSIRVANVNERGQLEASDMTAENYPWYMATLYQQVTNTDASQRDNEPESSFGPWHPTTSREQAIAMIANAWKQTRQGRQTIRDEVAQLHNAAVRKRRKEQVQQDEEQLMSR